MRVFQEADWILNESPKTSLLTWLRGNVGPNTKIIQNICGWEDHDAEHILAHIPASAIDGLYGFAIANPVDGRIATSGNKLAERNANNIQAVRKAFVSVTGSKRDV